jgi:anti-repressor protein
MRELIKIEQTVIGGKSIQSMSARDLYLGLGLNSTHWKRWAVSNIEQNEFFLEGRDWHGFAIMASGNETSDYAVSIEFAKHIAMQSRSENSHEYRTYMIQCEHKALAQSHLIPKTFAEALQLAADQQKLIEEQEKRIESDRPKVEFAMAVRNMQGACSVGDFAKVIGTGQNRLFKKMRDDRILMASNRPYQLFIERGLFVVIEQIPYTDSEGRTHPAFKTMITGKGQVFLEHKYRNTFGKNKAA